MKVLTRILTFACVAAGLFLVGCGSGNHAGEKDYAQLINRSGKTGMTGNGSFAAGSNSHPGYTELPNDVGSRGSLAPGTGNHSSITYFMGSLRGNGIANDSGGIGIGVH